MVELQCPVDCPLVQVAETSVKVPELFSDLREFLLPKHRGRCLAYVSVEPSDCERFLVTGYQRVADQIARRDDLHRGQRIRGGGGASHGKDLGTAAGRATQSPYAVWNSLHSAVGAASPFPARSDDGSSRHAVRIRRGDLSPAQGATAGLPRSPSEGLPVGLW